ncbi:MAG: Tfp pilus assembly protein PilE [Kiritimatiellia bacterium]|jgi:Tfp pilus assembly protein PilE
MMVTSIIGVLASVAIPTYQRYGNRARFSEAILVVDEPATETFNPPTRRKIKSNVIQWAVVSSQHSYTSATTRLRYNRTLALSQESNS